MLAHRGVQYWRSSDRASLRHCAHPPASTTVIRTAMSMPRPMEWRTCVDLVDCAKDVCTRSRATYACSDFGDVVGDALQSPAWIRRRDTVIAPQGSLDKHATYKGAAIWNCLRHSGAATWTVYVAVAGAGGCCECDRDSWIWQVQGVCRCVMLLGVTPISKVVGQGR